MEKYVVAKYIRLSLADGDNKESESVENQRDLLDDFIKKKGEFTDIYEYVDDGFSGGNFNRPSFQQMLDDIKNNKINCVITKDLSRFGREHIDTGYYLEKYFPSINLRFIAVNDCVDTIDANGLQFLQFKLSFNDYYLQDLSNKIKAVKNKKKLSGELVGIIAPYGYLKDPNQKNHFIIDNEVAPIVKEIFEMYAYRDIGAQKIANELSERKIMNPVTYKKMKMNNTTGTNIWQRSMVLRILNNQTYLGSVVSNRVESTSPKMRKCKRNSKDDYIIVENRHEPIIDKELWDAVHRKKSKYTYNTKAKREYPLKGLVYCGICGSKANFDHKTKKVNGEIRSESVAVFCNKRIKGCPNRLTNERELLKLVRETIIKELDNIAYTTKEFNKILEKTKKHHFENDNEQNIKKLEKKLENIKNKISYIYRKKLEKNISFEDFKVEYERLNNEKNELEMKISNIKDIKENTESKIENNKKLIKIARKYVKMEKPDNETLKALVKRIVYDINGVTIELNFESAFKK